MKVADSIREILKERNLAQGKVACSAGFSPKTFSSMLCGRKTIRIEYIPQICKAMGITPNELCAKVGQSTEGEKGA